jgi:hypothetical protein
MQEFTLTHPVITAFAYPCMFAVAIAAIVLIPYSIKVYLSPADEPIEE